MPEENHSDAADSGDTTREDAAATPGPRADSETQRAPMAPNRGASGLVADQSGAASADVSASVASVQSAASATPPAAAAPTAPPAAAHPAAASIAPPEPTPPAATPPAAAASAAAPPAAAASAAAQPAAASTAAAAPVRPRVEWRTFSGWFALFWLLAIGWLVHAAMHGPGPVTEFPKTFAIKMVVASAVAAVLAFLVPISLLDDSSHHANAWWVAWLWPPVMALMLVADLVAIGGAASKLMPLLALLKRH